MRRFTICMCVKGLLVSSVKEQFDMVEMNKTAAVSSPNYLNTRKITSCEKARCESYHTSNIWLQKNVPVQHLFTHSFPPYYCLLHRVRAYSSAPLWHI